MTGSRVFLRAGEVIDQELKIPDRIASVLIEGGIFQANIFEFNIIFQEKPVADSDFQGACSQQSVFFLILDQNIIQIHPVKERKTNMLDADLRMQIFRESCRYFLHQKVLYGLSLNKNPYQQ